jgi:pimeloyl-ACP methyl ester carboxylesterase
MTADPVEMTFHVDGTECAASLYLPADRARSVPCVVMANGLGGTKDFLLPLYARRFAADGLAVLAFDYRHFGTSGGTPRQLLHATRQQEDYRAAISFARSLPAVDPGRIALWGVSLGGLHAMTIGSSDPDISAVIALTPGLFISRHALPMLAKIAVTGLADATRMLCGRRPHLRPLVGDPGEHALVTDARAKRILRPIIEAAPSWRNEISFAGIFTLLRPRRVSRLTMPLMVGVADYDKVVSTTLGIRAAQNVPRVEIRHYPAGHDDIHLDSTHEQVVDDQLTFLRAHLDV